MGKYYFRTPQSEMCYTLDYHLEYMQENNIKKLIIVEAKAVFGTGYFYCKHFTETGLFESGISCGAVCDEYKPRNNKNGICVHSGNVYEHTDKELKIKI